MDFGLLFFSSGEGVASAGKYDLLFETVRYADANGFSSVWVPERHFSHYGCIFPNPTVVLASLAATTRHIGLRAGSVALPLHDPIRVAEEWAVLDNLSGGRAGFAAASGWHPNDFVLFPDRYAQRHSVLENSLGILDWLWRGGKITRRGGDGRDIEIRTYPTPVQKRLPLWLAVASRPEGFEYAGRVGANIITHLLSHDIPGLAEKVGRYRRALEQSGFDPGEGVVSLWIHAFVGENAELTQRRAADALCDYFKSDAREIFSGLAFHHKGQKIDIGRFSPSELREYMLFIVRRLMANHLTLFGSKSSCQETVARLRDIGVDELCCQLDFGLSQAEVMRGLTHLNELRLECRRETGRRAVVTPLKVPPPSSGTPESASASPTALTRIRQRCGLPLPIDAFYERLERSGLHYGRAFRLVREVWIGELEALGLVEAAADHLDNAFWFHPALLDSCLQVLAAAIAGNTAAQGGLMLAGIDQVTREGPLSARLWSHARVVRDHGGDIRTVKADIDVLNDAGEIVCKIRGMTMRSVAARENGLERCIYGLNWEPLSLPAAVVRTREAGRVAVLFSDSSEFAAALRSVYLAHGLDCVLVRSSQSFSFDPVAGATVDPLSREDHERLFEHIARHYGGSVDVIYAGGLDTPSGGGTRADSIEPILQTTCGQLLHLIHASAAPQGFASPKVTVVTANTQAVHAPTEVTAPERACLWGLARTARLELPELAVRLLDLDVVGPESAIRVATECLDGDEESELAYRAGERFVARLVAGRLDEAESSAPNRDPLIRTDRCYLVTGGLGSLGLQCARWLLDQGAREVLLMSRRAPGERAHAKLEALRRPGVVVRSVAADVSSRISLSGALREATMPLGGIVHAAGSLDDGVIHQQNWERCRELVGTKIRGILNLHELTSQEPVEFLVAFSSAAAVLGSSGQANYCMANAFLDAFATWRNTLGHRTVAIGWGPFAEAGMAAELDERHRARAEQRGIVPIQAEEGVGLLAKLLAGSASNLSVLPFDWPRFFAAYGELVPVPGTLRVLQAQFGKARPELAARRAQTLESFWKADEAGQVRLVRECLEHSVRAVLRIGSAAVDPEASLLSMGMDSLMSVEIKNAVRAALDVDLPVVRLLEGVSLAQLCEYVHAELQERGPVAGQELEEETELEVHI